MLAEIGDALDHRVEVVAVRDKRSKAPGGVVVDDSVLRTQNLAIFLLAGWMREAELAGRVAFKSGLSGADHAWSYVFLVSERSRGDHR